ncbi:helix-turn-helix transcriptional regulator [Archaeoglobus fulgidus]|nr:MarR family transcriptional regulator [Archaeoglobus fulgidus]AIG96973.1 MarR family [Archaeoglobus fulgidus DSM 8774]KUJ92482.1 MAG: hypothetical protein XD40_2320 [Archaeoglobus fulgidus]KUK05555.1 MAG: hypothetical protein XD48_2213 [Archaeoglobus fulgidus]
MKVRSSEAVLLVAGIFLLFLYLSFSPMSHHYMMMGPAYMGILPIIFGMGGLILIFLSAYLILSTQDEKAEVVQEAQTATISEAKERSTTDKLETAMKLLNDDEAMVLKIIAENEGITQDSLRARTDFSNSKMSMIIKKLEEKDLIVREKFGKTFKVYLSEWVKE